MLPAFQIGITRHFFSFEGKLPELRLRLKICAKGLAIESPINFISLVDVPYTSQLDLGARPLMIFFYMFRSSIGHVKFRNCQIFEINFFQCLRSLGPT